MSLSPNITGLVDHIISATRYAERMALAVKQHPERLEKVQQLLEAPDREDNKDLVRQEIEALLRMAVEVAKSSKPFCPDRAKEPFVPDRYYTGETVSAEVLVLERLERLRQEIIGRPFQLTHFHARNETAFKLLFQLINILQRDYVASKE